ncbi:MAG: hypothetical protein ABI462_09650 [Ignavibacteria bacterium]
MESNEVARDTSEVYNAGLHPALMYYAPFRAFLKNLKFKEIHGKGNMYSGEDIFIFNYLQFLDLLNCNNLFYIRYVSSKLTFLI